MILAPPRRLIIPSRPRWYSPRPGTRLALGDLGYKALAPSAGSLAYGSGGNLRYYPGYFLASLTVGSGSFVAPVTSAAYNVVLIGGGGSGGGNNGGGGGAGELLVVTGISLTAGVGYSFTVGAGGTTPPGVFNGNDGADSSFSDGVTTWTAKGGGGGGVAGGTSQPGRPGGCGGGGGGLNGGIAQPGGAGSAGGNGGSATLVATYSSGGGGGMSANGGNGSPTTGGGGGIGGAVSVGDIGCVVSGGGGGWGATPGTGAKDTNGYGGGDGNNQDAVYEGSATSADFMAGVGSGGGGDGSGSVLAPGIGAPGGIIVYI